MAKCVKNSHLLRWLIDSHPLKWLNNSPPPPSPNMPMPLSLETMNPMEPMLHGKRDCADAIKIINIKREIILNYLGVKNHVKVLVAQLCLTLYDPIDCSPPGSSVHGLL